MRTVCFNGLICVILLFFFSQAGIADSGSFYVPWGHVGGGKGNGYDAFIALRNLDSESPIIAHVVYRNQDGSVIRDAGDVTVPANNTVLIDVEDTVLNWAMGSAEIDWSGDGNGKLIGAAYMLDRNNKITTDIPVISSEDTIGKVIWYVPYGRINRGPDRGIDVLIFLKNTSESDSVTVNLLYRNSTNSGTRQQTVSLNPLGSAFANVEDVVELNFAWGSGEITWTELSSGTVVAGAVLINWDSLLVSGIPVK